MKKIIIMGIPYHSNIGDSAIAIAEKNIIKTYFKDYEVFYMPERKLDVCCQRIKKLISKDDIILLHGGGNIGDTYSVPEKGRRTVIKEFPDNKIIIFPQTMYFSDTEKGRKELEETKTIYNEHKHLIILAREKKTYELMKKHFVKATIYLTPDIVMTMKKSSINKRSGALLVFRNDQEKSLDNSNREKIINTVKEKYPKYKFSDMLLEDENNNVLWGKYRNKVIQEKFEQFQNSEIVVTDRLHGMIFAAVTETPCIAFGNFNHKVEQSYEWIKNLEYIKFCKDINDIGKLIEDIQQINDIKYDNNYALDIILPILRKEINE